MSHGTAVLLYWSPRVLAMAFALFLGFFALDVFRETQGFGAMLLAFCIHLIPATLVVVALLAAWRWEWIGAGLFVLLAAFYAWEVLPRHVGWALTIDVPLLLIAALFLASWMQRRKLHTAL